MNIITHEWFQWILQDFNEVEIDTAFIIKDMLFDVNSSNHVYRLEDLKKVEAFLLENKSELKLSDKQNESTLILEKNRDALLIELRLTKPPIASAYSIHVEGERYWDVVHDFRRFVTVMSTRNEERNEDY